MDQIDPKIDRIIIKMFQDYIDIQQGESVLVATDYPSKLDVKMRDLSVIERIYNRNILAKYIHQVAKQHFDNSEFDFLAFKCPWQHYPPIEDHLKEELSNCNILVLLTEFTHRNYVRPILETKQNIRVVNSPMIDESVFMPSGPLDIDVDKMEREVMEVYVKFKQGSVAKVWTEKGTEITIDLTNVQIGYETGKVNYHGKVSNLPGGEVVLFRPKISGKATIPEGWISSKNPRLFFELKDGNIIKIESENPEKKNWINNVLVKRDLYPVQQLVFGLNKNATNPFSVLELEKMRGVCNLVISEGLKPTEVFDLEHFTGHFPSPNINLEIDGERIFKDGRLVF